jgi:hypothetical protein
MRWSLHPGGKRRPEPVSEPPEEEVTVFHPEEAATDGNPFPEELMTEEVVEEAPDYNSMTVPQLRELLAERGLTVSGVKAELIARLEADDAGPSDEAPDESAEVPSDEATSSDEMPEEGEVSESGEQ